MSETNDTHKSPRHKGIYILPNLLTTASLFAGFLGMTMAMKGNFEACAVAILVSCVFDGLDGKVARLTGTSSEFGVQLDSLADLVAFGVSPAIMLYLWHLQDLGRLGLMAAFLFIACGALRLARFNVQTKTSGKLLFTGLPIPAAGCTMATLVLFQRYLPHGLHANVLPSFCLVLTYVLSFLMVSKVRYFSFKEYGWFKAHPFGSMVTAILLFVLIASQPKLLGFPLFFLYLVSGIVYTFLIMPRKHRSLLRENIKKIFS